jgi:hypothetical protein
VRPVDGSVTGHVDLTSFRALGEVVELSTDGPVIRLVVDRVAKLAATFILDRIVSQEGDLEDAFLRFYQEDEQ